MIGPLQVQDFDSQGGMVGKVLTLSKCIVSADVSLLRYLKEQIDQTMRLILISILLFQIVGLGGQKNRILYDVWRAQFCTIFVVLIVVS